jgi:glycosyltransferase involved in cell wall biosynthesis
VNLLTDETLQDNLKERGLRRARNFSWTKAAQEILSVYKRLR